MLGYILIGGGFYILLHTLYYTGRKNYLENQKTQIPSPSEQEHIERTIRLETKWDEYIQQREFDKRLTKRNREIKEHNKRIADLLHSKLRHNWVFLSEDTDFGDLYFWNPKLKMKIVCDKSAIDLEYSLFDTTRPSNDRYYYLSRSRCIGSLMAMAEDFRRRNPPVGVEPDIDIEQHTSNLYIWLKKQIERTKNDWVGKDEDTLYNEKECLYIIKTNNKYQLIESTSEDMRIIWFSDDIEKTMMAAFLRSYLKPAREKSFLWKEYQYDPIWSYNKIFGLKEKYIGGIG